MQTTARYQPANQDPSVEYNMAKNFDEPKSGGLRKERIIIIILSVLVVALSLVIVALLFFQSSSSGESSNNIVPITIPARKANSQVNKTSKKSPVTKTTKSTTTTTYNPYPDYGAGGNSENTDQVDKNDVEATETPVEENEGDYEEDYVEDNGDDENQEVGNSDFMGRLTGTWDMISTENFDQIMEKLGVSWFKRKLAANLKPTVIISKKPDNTYSIKTVSSLKTSEIVFTLDTPFKEVTLDDKDVTTTITLDGDRLVQTQRDLATNTKVICTITREIDENDQMITYVQVDNVVSKRVYKRS